jgi:DNA-binding Lrp family transcriptional regulator
LEVIEMVSMDRLDVELLELLSRDARAGVVELASTLGISRNTVQSRLKRMEDSGLLNGYRPELDLARAGIASQAFIGLEIQQGRLASIEQALEAMPQVLEVHATTGREDFLVRVATQTQAELQELIERILLVPGVVHSSTTLALTTPLRYRAVPLLKHITRDAGWGRSTPSQRAE